MRTLRVFKYRGYRVYVRHLFGETFEYLIPYKGEMLQNGFEIAKEPGKKLKNYTKEEFKKITQDLSYVAQAFLDEKTQGRTVKAFNKFIYGNTKASSVPSTGQGRESESNP